VRRPSLVLIAIVLLVIVIAGTLLIARMQGDLNRGPFPEGLPTVGAPLLSPR
jgi:hypothetical protein